MTQVGNCVAQYSIYDIPLLLVSRITLPCVYILDQYHIDFLLNHKLVRSKITVASILMDTGKIFAKQLACVTQRLQK